MTIFNPYLGLALLNILAIGFFSLWWWSPFLIMINLVSFLANLKVIHAAIERDKLTDQLMKDL